MPGDEDSCIQFIDFKGIVAVAAESANRPEPSVSNVIAHNRVINSVLRSTTPVPCRFGTVLSQRDLDVYVETNRPALNRLLEKFRGCLEMALRITSSAQDRVNTLSDQVQPGLNSFVEESGGPGTQFLASRARRAVREKIADQRASEVLAWADSQFSPLVKDRVARLRPESALVADIAHLVSRRAIHDYRESFESARRQRADLRLSISGPWAPYSFAASDDSVA